MGNAEHDAHDYLAPGTGVLRIISRVGKRGQQMVERIARHVLGGREPT